MTPQNLKASPRKTLETLARKRGVAGCTSMKKDELIRAILKTVSSVRARGQGSRVKNSGAKATRKPESGSAPKSSSKPRANQISAARRTAAPKRINGGKTNGHGAAIKAGRNGSNGKSVNRLLDSGVMPNRNLADPGVGVSGGGVSPDQDHLAAMVLGPYWIRAHWKLSPQGVRRAELSLGTDWHRATPVLRVMDVSPKEGSSNIEIELEQIVIHGGVRDWYIPLDGRPRSYRLQIGYCSPSGKFYSLARSNIVTPPLPGNPDSAQGHWMDMVENCEQVYAMSGGYSEQHPQSPLKGLFEERLSRKMDPGPVYADVPALGQGRVESGVNLTLKTEVIIYGVTTPNAQVVFEGKPVKLDDLNSFRLRMPLNEGRHVVPISATNSQTSEQQTAVLAIERNLKNLDLKTPEDF